MNKPPKDTSAIQSLPPVDRKSLESGLITKGAVAEARRPETSAEELLNFHCDTIGAATLRPGQTAIGPSLGSAILGMHYFVDSLHAGSHTQLVVVNGTNASYLSASSWVPIRMGLTAGAKARFSTYLDFMFMVNGSDATSVWNGDPAGGFVTSGNASSAPIGSYIENFRSRMWIAGNSTYPDRLYYSSIPSSITLPVITWNTDPTTGQWIDISPSDGDTTTALQRFKNTMLVFKTNRLYRVFDIGQVDPDPYYSVGTSSAESVVETKTGIFFHHSSGFYQYNVYGVVQEISGPLRKDIMQAIPPTSYSSVTGWIEADQDHVCWSVGTVTVRGITYTNLVLRYTISTMVWTHYNYPTQMLSSVRRQPLYTDSISQYAVTGDNAGNVLKVNVGKQDVGADGSAKPIPYSIIHKWETLDGLLSTRKNVMTANFSHYGGTGSTVAYQTEEQDPDDLNNWKQPVGQPSQFRQINTGFNSMNIKARKFRFRIFGESTGDPFVYNGYEIIDAQAEFIQFEEN